MLAASFVALLALAAGGRATGGGDRACAEALAQLGPLVVQSAGPTYLAAASGAWNLLNDAQRPACIVFPNSAGDVQVTMRAIFRAGARYAVQSGGHSAMLAWNNVEQGVLVHFGNMQSVQYDAQSGAITLQPGVHWGAPVPAPATPGDVFKLPVGNAVASLAPFGVAPVGGREADVGTGLLLGGGLSFLSPAHGFAADVIRAADVVLPNGTFVTASPTQHADLFRALKGGGNRFGIVTRYVVDAIHTGTATDLEWFGGSIIYANDSADAVLAATADYVATTTDPKAVLLVAFINIVEVDVVTPLIMVNPFYNGASLPPSIFGKFLAIPATSSTLTPLSYEGVASVLDPGAERGSAWHYGASALVGSLPLFAGALRAMNNFTAAFSSDLALSVLAFTPVLQHQIDAGRARGGNAIAPPDGPYAAVQLSQQLAAGVASISPALQHGINTLFAQVPRSRGKPLFMNECDRFQNVYETYGDYEFLKRTYATYDPTRFIVNHMDGPIGL